MSYIGRGVDAISNVEKLDNITFNGGTTYALTKGSAAFTPVGANNILISIDWVIQQGNFSVSTTNIVFDWSPTSSNTCNFILHYGTGVLNVPADGAVSTAKLAADAVTGAKIADDQIDSEHYIDGSIDTAHLGNLQVTTAKIAADAIDGTKLADDAVNSEHYTDGSIDLAHMSSESVDEDNLHISNAGSNGQFLSKQSSNAGGLTWADSGGAWNLMQTITASSSATITFEHGSGGTDFTTYKAYVILAPLFTHSTDNTHFRISVDTSSTTYNASIARVTKKQDLANNSSNDNGGFTSGAQDIGYGLGNAGGEGHSLVLWIFNPASTSVEKNMHYEMFCHLANNGIERNHGMIQMESSSSAILGVRFDMNSGNIAAGDFKLYGIT